ncbi:MAG: hypothetical protein R6X34_03925 [Chloroflexota bacterium]
MKQLAFSMMEGQALQQQLERALYKFTLEEQIVVDIQDLPWENGRSQLVDIALFKGGVDVSEVGTTWLSSLVSINGLRPISSSEAVAFGGKSAFFPGSWDSATMGDQVSSIFFGRLKFGHLESLPPGKIGLEVNRVFNQNRYSTRIYSPGWLAASKN